MNKNIEEVKQLVHSVIALQDEYDDIAGSAASSPEDAASQNVRLRKIKQKILKYTFHIKSVIGDMEKPL